MILEPQQRLLQESIDLEYAEQGEQSLACMQSRAVSSKACCKSDVRF